MTVTATALTPKQAGELVGRTKAAIIKAIRDGRLSADRGPNNEYRIEPAELMRVYTPANTDAPKVGDSSQAQINGLQAEIEKLRELLEAEKRFSSATGADRDAWREQAQRLALAAPEIQAARRSIWSKLVGR